MIQKGSLGLDGFFRRWILNKQQTGCLIAGLIFCQGDISVSGNIENILTRTMLPEMASECLSKLAIEEDITDIHVDVSEEGQFNYMIS